MRSKGGNCCGFRTLLAMAMVSTVQAMASNLEVMVSTLHSHLPKAAVPPLNPPSERDPRKGSSACLEEVGFILGSHEATHVHMYHVRAKRHEGIAPSPVQLNGDRRTPPRAPRTELRGRSAEACRPLMRNGRVAHGVGDLKVKGWQSGSEC